MWHFQWLTSLWTDLRSTLIYYDKNTTVIRNAYCWSSLLSEEIREPAACVTGTECACSVASVVSDSLQSCRVEPARLLCPWDSPSKNTGGGCPALLQGIFPTQGPNPRLLHHSQICYRWAAGEASLFWSSACGHCILLLHVVWPFFLLYWIKSQISDFQLVKKKKLKLMHRVFYYRSNTPADKASVNSYGEFTVTEPICFLVYLFHCLNFLF